MKNLIHKIKFPMTFSMLHSKLKNSRKQGFSLIELLVVVAIIGVVAAVAIPAFQAYQNNAKTQTIVASLSNINKGYKACLVAKPGLLTDCDSLTEINVEKQAGTTDTRGLNAAANRQCFHIKMDTAVPDKKHQGCIEFDTTDGSTIGITYDDGTKTGVCATTGSCG